MSGVVCVVRVCSVVWCGVVCCVVLCGVVLCGVVWCSVWGVCSVPVLGVRERKGLYSFCVTFFASG